MFWSRPLVSQDMAVWIEECFDWFDARFAPPQSPILPTKAYFAAPGGTSPEVAEQVFSDIKRQMGFDGAVTLRALDVLPAEYRFEHGKTSEVAGSFQDVGGLGSTAVEAHVSGRVRKLVKRGCVAALQG